MGHLLQDTTNPSLGHTASFTYGPMNRLASSVATGSATHNLTFSYDRYGNMSCTVNGQTNGLCPQYSFNTATNRISNSGFTYDAAGDLTNDGTHSYQWDAEGRMRSVDSGSTASYAYNALGQRVEKQVRSAYTEYAFDAGGELVGEYDRTEWMCSMVPFAGRHLVHYQNGAAYFNHTNHLGTTGAVTDSSGSVAQDELHYPWGQEWAMAGTMQEERFARLHHRDSETGLDPTHFRMFSSGAGRWFSPDLVRGRVRDPQTLNLYAYVANNPISRIDPLGLSSQPPNSRAKANC